MVFFPTGVKNTATEPGRRLLATTGPGALAHRDWTIDRQDRTIGGSPTDQFPWYNRITRWGQVNITDKDPVQYDIPGGAAIGGARRRRVSSSTPVA